MTISNKNYFLLWRVLLVFLLLIVAADLVLSQLNGTISYYFAGHIPGMVASATIFVLGCVRINYFSYEDEYEIIHIRSKSLLFGSFESQAQTRYEFPKRIIHDFRYQNGFFQKRLIIYLTTQQGVKKVRKFNLNFVPFSKLQYVLESLENIRIKNEELKKDGKLEWT